MDYSGIVGVDSVSAIFNETAAEAAGADGIAGMLTAPIHEDFRNARLVGYSGTIDSRQ